jgi:hypothetical protein
MPRVTVTSLRFANVSWRSCGFGIQAGVGDLAQLDRCRHDTAPLERDPPAAGARNLRNQLVDVEPT